MMQKLRDKYPTLLLLVPPFIPAVVTVAVKVAPVTGLQLNPHAGLGLGLLVVLAMSMFAAVLVELFAVPVAIWALAHNPAMRTGGNLGALAIGVIGTMACGFWLLS